MVDEEDNIKLIDFGIAGDSAARRLTYANFTATLGTPNYISPEQVKGKRGDGRSDIYAMGVILYEMLSGKLPFTGPSPLAAMNDRLLNHPMPPSIANPSISPQLQEVLYRALERDPKNRYSQSQRLCLGPGASGPGGRGGPGGVAGLEQAKVAASAQDSLLFRAGPDPGGDSAADDSGGPPALIFPAWHLSSQESSWVPYAPNHTLVLDTASFSFQRRFMPKYKLEYIWLDGKEPIPELRGKTQLKTFEQPPTLADIPLWGFDGSSTMQAEGKQIRLRSEAGGFLSRCRPQGRLPGALRSHAPGWHAQFHQQARHHRKRS